jgi:hypothetical protein
MIGRVNWAFARGLVRKFLSRGRTARSAPVPIRQAAAVSRQ